MVNIPDGICYHSAFVTLSSNTALNTSETAKAIDYFAYITGKGLYLYNQSAGLHMGIPLWMCLPGSNDYTLLIQEGLIQGIMVILNLDELGDPSNGNLIVEQIGNGTWDTYLTMIANQAKAFGYPIYLKIGIEMNINQGVNTTWTSGENPIAFIAAWKRIVDIFRNEGVTNVTFVWNPNWNDVGPNHWTDYYPGDDYVDWVGIDLYQYQQNSDPDNMLQIYDDYCNRKPIAICEWGTNWESKNYTDESRAIFINKFFDAIETRPKIKMISYLYYSFFMFDPVNFPLTTEAYRNRISNSRYLIADVNIVNLNITDLSTGQPAGSSLIICTPQTYELDVGNYHFKATYLKTGEVKEVDLTITEGVNLPLDFTFNTLPPVQVVFPIWVIPIVLFGLAITYVVAKKK